jgi:hypothetical protein
VGIVHDGAVLDDDEIEEMKIGECAG